MCRHAALRLLLPLALGGVGCTNAQNILNAPGHCTP
jgi:hypothetical protein